MTSVLWHSARLQSSEHCTLSEVPDGHRLTGVVVVPLQGEPAHLQYQVDVDEQWRTRTVDIAVTRAGLERGMGMAADGRGHWLVGDEPLAEVEGCLDVDLGWTPSTNTLPIRRLRLDVGAAESISAAWVRFPELTVERSIQTYQRLEERRWRYSSGTFVAELDVDPQGLVLRYGPKLWKAVAHTEQRI